MFQYSPLPSQISSLLLFAPGSNLLEINKESCWGWGGGGQPGHQLEGDVREPVTFFVKSRGRGSRFHGVSDMFRLWSGWTR